MGTVQTAMLGGQPYPILRDAVFAHPTMTEGLKCLFAGLKAVEEEAEHYETGNVHA